MEFRFLFILTLIFFVCSGGIASSEQELKVISVKLENDVLKQGESAGIAVTVKNTGDSAVYDISFCLSLERSDIDDIKISGYTRMKDIEKYINYHIDTKTSLEPGETKTATFVINATSPGKEEYLLRFAPGARLGKDKVLYRDLHWWPTDFVRHSFKYYLEVELRADTYFKKAEEYFWSGSYENAKDYAKKAKEIYIKSGNEEAILNCDKIISQTNKIVDADVAYRRAKNRADNGDFRGALSNAKLSLKSYNEIPFDNPDLISDRLSELESLILELNKTITADDNYYQAKKYFDVGDYENAKKHAEMAKMTYLSIGDDESVSKCDSIIKKSEMNIGRNSTILKIGYAIGAIIILFIIYYIYSRHRSSDYSDLTISGTIKIPAASSGFSEVKNYSEIPEGAIEPYMAESIHDLIAQGKTIVKCNECGAYYNKEILEYYKMNCARFGCKNSTL